MEYENLPSDYRKTFSRFTNLLRFIGLGFFDAPNLNSKMRLILFNIFFLPFIGSQFYLITEIRAENFLEGAQIVPVSVMFVIDVLKMTIAVRKRSSINDLFMETGELWPRGDVSEEKQRILSSWLKRMGRLLDAFYIYAVINLVIFEVIPLLTTLVSVMSGAAVYVFPFQLIGLWDVDSLLSYVATYVWELCSKARYSVVYPIPHITLVIFELIPILITVVSVMSGAAVYVFPFRLLGMWDVDSLLCYVATYVWELCSTVPCQICLYLPFDMLIVITTSNVSVLLRLLQIDLENAVKVERKGNMIQKNDETVKEILRIVQDHQKLLRLAQQLSHIFGLVIFIHVAFSSVEICFFGFLTVVFGGVAETIANLLTVWNSVITIFLLALSGQLLYDTSTSVADAANKSLWYLSDVKVKKLILFIIIRSQRASYLSALGFSDMTLRSFSKIMSSAWTYFSLLIQVYEGK